MAFSLLPPIGFSVRVFKGITEGIQEEADTTHCTRGERTGRNPKTGEELKIAAAKVAAFKPGAMLKAAVNGNRK